MRTPKLGIPSRDVFRPNARTKRPFDGRIVGQFRRCGPNAWDPYVFEIKSGKTLNVLPGLRVHVEEEGVRVRLRYRGRVVVVEWTPTEDEAGSSGADPAYLRRRFLQTYLGGYASKPALGAAGVVARKLRR